MKTITAYSQHYSNVLNIRLFEKGLKVIFLLNTVSILLTYLFDFASCQLCYLKLVIIFCANTLFWFISFPYLIEKTSTLSGQWRKNIISGLTVVCINQIVVVLGWVAIIGAFYDCLSLDFIPPIILQNNILFSILSFLVVVSCVYFENAKNNANSLLSIINTPTSKIESVNYLKSISIKNGTTTTLIPVEKIYCIEADDNTIEFRTQMGKFVSYQSLKSIETQLDPEVFKRIYRSTIVNKAYIKKIKSLSSGDSVVSLENGESLKMSRHYKAQFNCGI